MIPLTGIIKAVAIATLFFSTSDLISVVSATPLDNNGNNGTPQTTEPISYGLMIDAGSSGSRILPFYWRTVQPGELNVAVNPLLKNNKDKQLKAKIKPGLSLQTPEGVAEYFRPLIEEGKKFIPAEKHGDTIIFLKATAGMRLVPLAQRQKIIEAVPFKFDPAVNVQVISGEDEGVFGWLTINSLLNRLSSATTPGTVAILDLGGASTEITFKPNLVPLEGTYRTRINGTNYNLYTHSYLRLGVNEARDRVIAALAANSKDNTVHDPCMLKGQTQAYKLGSVVVNLVGQGQFEECHRLTKSVLLGRKTFCATEPCAINGVHQPDIPDNMPIYAISNFNDVADVFGCHGKSTPGCIYTSAQDKCNRLTAEEFKAPFSDNVSVESACFAASLSLALTFDSYRIPNNREVYYVDRLPIGQLGWALGAMIDAVNNIKLDIQDK
ncbi:nucleoside phosphatase GDA1/CD39 [Syncephalis fuscata]|nr:nucleoside phosphatase GDA1/CD39 [Syncephalis fuscata]